MLVRRRSRAVWWAEGGGAEPAPAETALPLPPTASITHITLLPPLSPPKPIHPPTHSVLLEARDIIGGRVKQDTTFLPGCEVECGAEFIHGDINEPSELCEVSGNA